MPSYSKNRVFHLNHKEHIVPELFTGLKDKNGTDIFEKDKIRIQTNDGIKDLVVEFVLKKGCYCLVEKSYIGVSYLLETFIVNDTKGESYLNGEVVGNINHE